MRNEDYGDSTVCLGPGGTYIRQYDEDGRVEVGTTCPVNLADERMREEGHLVNLRPTGDGRFRAQTVKGPAKVNSPTFRKNWDTIFGKKQTVGQA